MPQSIDEKFDKAMQLSGEIIDLLNTKKIDVITIIAALGNATSNCFRNIPFEERGELLEKFTKVLAKTIREQKT